MALERFTRQEENRIRIYFRVSVFLKGAFSAVESLGGVLAFFVPLSYFTDFVARYAQGELAEDPGDYLATHLLHFAHQFSITSSVFIGIYLLSRGLIKLGLVIALLKNKLWAYPSSLALLTLFVLYQIYQITVSYSTFITLLTLFDLVVMWSIWKEYEVLRSSRG